VISGSLGIVRRKLLSGRKIFCPKYQVARRRERFMEWELAHHAVGVHAMKPCGAEFGDGVVKDLRTTRDPAAPAKPDG